MYCKNCGKEIPGDAKYCQFCGTDQIVSIKKQKYIFYFAIAIFWIGINALLYCVGGQGYTFSYKVSEQVDDPWMSCGYSTQTRTITNFIPPSECIYPFGKSGIVWNPMYYDSTEFVLYGFIIPIVLLASCYIIYRLYKNREYYHSVFNSIMKFMTTKEIKQLKNNE